MGNEQTNWSQSAAAVCIREGKVLLARHTYGTGKGRLIIPGGYVEYGEKPQDAVKREYMEEVGVEIEPRELIGIRFNSHDWYAVFAADYVSGTARSDGDENSEVIWMDTAEALRHPDVPELSKIMISRALAPGKWVNTPYDGSRPPYSLYCAQEVSMEQTAYFAGGCFWCITPVFNELDGVHRVISGYSGGDEADPDYEDVKYQRTGHRETIRIDYDPQLVSFDRLLEIFLENVDPFDGEGQFIDRGHSYTLAVYTTCPAQEESARRHIARLAETSSKQVHISVEPFKSFYSAAEVHQNYYLKHPQEFEQEMIDSGRKLV